MALKIDFPLAGGVVAQGAYLMAHRIMRDRLTGQIMGEAWVYASRAARLRAEDMLRAHRANMEALRLQTEALNAVASEVLEFPEAPNLDGLPPAQAQELGEAHYKAAAAIQEAYDARIKAADEARDKARAAAVASERALGEPDAKPVRALGFEIPPDQADGMADASGNADLAKVYAWLKTQPAFKGAVDA